MISGFLDDHNNEVFPGVPVPAGALVFMRQAQGKRFISSLWARLIKPGVLNR